MQALHLHVLQLLVLTLQTTSGLMASSAGTSIFSKTAAARSPPAVCLPRPRPAERHLLIDGNNLMAHRKVTKGREALAARLAGIRPARVTLVFDGKRGELPSESGSNPRVVVTSGGDEESAPVHHQQVLTLILGNQPSWWSCLAPCRRPRPTAAASSPTAMRSSTKVRIRRHSHRPPNSCHYSLPGLIIACLCVLRLLLLLQAIRMQFTKGCARCGWRSKSKISQTGLNGKRAPSSSSR